MNREEELIKAATELFKITEDELPIFLAGANYADHNPAKYWNRFTDNLPDKNELDTGEPIVLAVIGEDKTGATYELRKYNKATICPTNYENLRYHRIPELTKDDIE